MLSEELSKMSKKIHSADSNSENKELELIVDAYRKAAEYDDYMFGNIDYVESWLGITTSK